MKDQDRKHQYIAFCTPLTTAVCKSFQAMYPEISRMYLLPPHGPSMRWWAPAVRKPLGPFLGAKEHQGLRFDSNPGPAASDLAASPALICRPSPAGVRPAVSSISPHLQSDLHALILRLRALKPWATRARRPTPMSASARGREGLGRPGRWARLGQRQEVAIGSYGKLLTRQCLVIA